MLQRARIYILHRYFWLLTPYLIVSIPALAYASQNANEGILSPAIIATPVLILSAAVAALFALINVLVKDKPKSALLAIIIAFVPIFLYPVVWDSLFSVSVLGVAPFRHRFMLPALVLIIGIGGVLIVRSRYDFRPLLRSMGYASLLLVIFNIVTIISASPASPRELPKVEIPEGLQDAASGLPFIVASLYYRE